MKRIYIILFTLPVLAFCLLYLSVWWFIGGLAALMIFIAYRFYVEQLDASESRSELLENELEELHDRLESAVSREQKATREADHVKELKQQLLSVISHEVRTPMNGILGMSVLLADTPLTEEQQEYINTIRNCGESLLTTINNLLANDILDFSKLHQGHQLEYKDFDLRDAVEEVMGLIAGKAGIGNIDLIYSIDGDVPLQIIGDSKRLRQVLINLVENAVKFTTQGEVFIGVHYTPSMVAGYPPELYFEVRDTGIGIPANQVKYLFKGIPGKESPKENSGDAAGLGLVICRKLVELMGGRIEVSSEEGAGSTFTFNMPLTPALRSPRNEEQHNNINSLEGKHVLIIDDNATQRSVLLSQMKSWKMKAVIAESGKLAMALLAKDGPFDLVITDMTMAGMDGIKLAGSIKEEYPGLPVILMSPQGNEQYKQSPRLFASVITKPLRQYMLRDHILRVFNGTGNNKNETDQMADDFSKQYPLHILVAEDNVVNQKIAMKILTKLGYQPVLAQNGKEALEMAGNDQYDLILMDVQMPEMDGLDATRMMRTCLTKQPIIIAMTANVMQGDRDACLQAGMDDYISKPVNLQELLTQLEKWSLVIRKKRA